MHSSIVVFARCSHLSFEWYYYYRTSLKDSHCHWTCESNCLKLPSLRVEEYWRVMLSGVVRNDVVDWLTIDLDDLRMRDEDAG